MNDAQKVAADPFAADAQGFSPFAAMRAANAAFLAAASALPSVPSAEQVDAVIDLMRSYLAYGPWSSSETDRMCAAKSASLLNGGSR